MRSPTKDASRLHELDALRFVAALAVVLYHLTYSNTVQAAFPEVDGVTRFGYMGVDLFFIISGFVILWSAQGRSPVAFVIARFSRLYPIFWVALLTTSAVVWHDGVITMRQILLNATMIPSYFGAGFIDGAYWTLQVELNFYFLIFVLLVFGQINNAERWAYGWLVVIALSLVTHKIPASLTVYPYGSYFAGGMILFAIWKSGLTWTRCVALGGSLLLSMRQAVIQANEFIYHMTGNQWVPVAVIGTSYLVLLGIAAGRIKIGAAKWCTALGASTYPLYLLHHHIGNEIFGALTLDRWVALAITLLAIAAMTVVATGIDRRLHRFTSQWLTAWSIRLRLQPAEVTEQSGQRLK
jgi:peptidoglycan/LPS O-acetylase OafA/YrhL